MITLILLWIIYILSYWLVFNSNQNWFIWSKFSWMLSLRNQFEWLNWINTVNYHAIVNFNFLRKIIFWIIISAQLKWKLPAFIFISLMLSAQLVYFNLIFVSLLFDSLFTRLLSVYNEIIFTISILIVWVEYKFFTSDLDSDSVFRNIMSLLSQVLRAHLIWASSLCLINMALFLLCRLPILWKRKSESVQQPNIVAHNP